MSDIFGDRMKRYEAVSDIRLTERIPILIRLDGNSFSLFTKVHKFKKPFDDRFADCMRVATRAVLKYCSGAMLGYTQSDEITVLIRNDQKKETQPFLANRLEKLCSLVASTASVYFSSHCRFLLDQPWINAIFDCRVYLVPESEVVNAFLWRQQDAWKNCVSAVAYYGLKEKYGKKQAMSMLDGKSTNERQEIVFQELGLNMNNYPTKYKRGICIARQTVKTPIEEIMSLEKVKKLSKEGEIVERSVWTVDEEIPLFSEDRQYIEKFLRKDG